MIGALLRSPLCRLQARPSETAALFSLCRRPRRLTATDAHASLCTPIRLFANLPPSSTLRSVVTALEATGPCPLSKLSASLPDEVAERLAQSPGGFLAYCQAARSAVRVVLIDVARKGQSKMPVAIPQDLFHHVTRTDEEIVAYIVGLLAVAKWAPGSSILKDATPLASDVLVVVQTSSLPAHVRLTLRGGLTAVQKLVRRCPQLLVLDMSGKRIKLAPMRRRTQGRNASPQTAPSAMMITSSAAHPAAQAENSTAMKARHNPWRRFVMRVVPSTFFVPASFMCAQKAFRSVYPHAPPEANPDDVLAVLLESQQRGELQVVELAPLSADQNRLSGVYVRSLLTADMSTGERGAGGAASDLASSLSFTTAAEQVAEASALDPLALTQSVAAAIAAYETQHGNMARLRLIKGLSAEDLFALLPEVLVTQLVQFFGPTSDPATPTAAAGERAVLLLDRMRHLFDVDLAAMRVRPWSVLPAEDLPSSLTWQTTPLPLAVMTLQDALFANGPQSVAQLVSRMPASVSARLFALYDMDFNVPQAWRGADDERRTALETKLASVPEATKVAIYRTFLSQHSLYFTETDGLVYTPQLLADRQRQRGARATHSDISAAATAAMPAEDATDLHTLTEAELVARIAATLPADEVVSWGALLAELTARGFPVAKIPVQLFAQYPHVFDTYESFLAFTRVIARRGAQAPASALLQPPLDTLEDIITYVAIRSCNGASENILMQTLPPHVRASFKLRVGSVTNLVEQLPQWFSVRRDIHNEGSSVITYIGASAVASAATDSEPGPHRTLTPMRNVGLQTWRHEPLHKDGSS